MSQSAEARDEPSVAYYLEALAAVSDGNGSWLRHCHLGHALIVPAALTGLTVPGQLGMPGAELRLRRWVPRPGGDPARGQVAHVFA